MCMSFCSLIYTCSYDMQSYAVFDNKNMHLLYKLPYYCIVYSYHAVYHTMALLLTCMAIFTIIEK